MNYPKFLPWIFLIAAYLIGSIPNGLIVSKLLHRKDIRKEGSGNIGATNALRAFGTVTGLFVLLLDVAMGYFPTLLAMSILGKDNSFVSIIALFVILGHMFPVYLKFKGGKGVATAAGVFLAIAPISLSMAILVFLIVVVLFHYVSLASICAAMAFHTHSLAILLKAEKADYATLLLISVAVLLIVVKHKSNLERLINGSESKLKFTKKGN